MKREIAAMETQESAARKRRESVEEVAVDGGEIIGVPNTKRVKLEASADGEIGSGDVDTIELPKTKGGEVECGTSKEEGSSTGKPAGATKKRRRKATFMINRKVKYCFEMNPTKPVTLNFPNETVIAAINKLIKFESGILKQFETKGYAVYERELEVTDDEDPLPSSVSSLF